MQSRIATECSRPAPHLPCYASACVDRRINPTQRPLAQAEAGYRLECPSRDVDHAIPRLHRCHRSRWLKSFYGLCDALRRILVERGRFARAAADCEEAIELGTNSPAAYLIRGIAHADKGEHNAAVVEYGRSIELTADARGLLEPRYGPSRAR